MSTAVSAALQTNFIAHAIQLSIAPAFLLTGLGAMLSVMANRLARVIDRARWLEEHWLSFDEPRQQRARRELRMIERRRRVCSWAINLTTAGALLVCLVIVSLFADEFLAADLSRLPGALFVAAMLSVCGGLVCFLREVYIATHVTAIRSEGLG
ncbi:DUF2721 domain-containing protein [Roseateles paludis]|jgi:hypothetical protein|uniref:DUF2721 domain-containing protein n=1 Tax=Roseateles paludis TaxID=3145238 RepID=A0ABV0G0B4_9BURK